MPGTLASRRVAALACLFGATASAGPLAAQIPVGTGDVAPTLLSDCDITIQSCGTPGGELYGSPPSYGSSGGGGGFAPMPQCGGGWRSVCRSITAETCAEWVIVEASGKVTFSPTSAGVGGSITQVCSRYVTTTLTFYIYV